MIEYDLQQWLAACEPVAALLGTGASTDPIRIYPCVFPQAPKAVAASYRRVSTSRDHSTGDPGGLVAVVLEWVIFSPADNVNGYAAAKATADAIRYALPPGNIQMGGTFVQRITMDGERDEYDDEVRAFLVSFELTVIFTESPPA